MADIDSLSIQISSDSSRADKGLKDLKESLKNLREATKGGLGLSSVANQVGKIADASNKISSTTISNLKGFADAVKLLSNLGGIKISSSIGNQITNINTALQGLNLNGANSKIQGLVSSLQPLVTLGKSNLGSMVNTLKKLPETFQSLQNIDMGAFASKIREVANAVKPLADEMQKVANGFSAFPSRIQKLITDNGRLSSSNNELSSSYINLYAKLKMAYSSLKTIARGIASLIAKSSTYVENMNLFTVAMGKYADEARQYAESVSEVMGIDPGEWARNQGVFMTLATGFGVVGDRAYIMSKNLTQLGYDISSFFNIPYEQAMQKLQSGLAGELEPLRRIGYDLSVARLQQEAYTLGIQKKVSAMTQAEKAELRYHAILTQVTTAQGDMARTLEAPANQMRILKAQIDMASRSLGNLFLPILQIVLPYLIAFAKVVRMVADVIAGLFDVKLSEFDFSSSGIGDMVSGTEDLGNALDNASESAKKLQKYTMGFDELNVIDPNQGSGSGNTTGGIGGSGFSFDLPEYNFLEGLQESKVATIVGEMKEWLGLTGEIDSWSEFFDTRLGNILKTVTFIGVGLSAWKITTSTVTAISTLKNAIDNLGKSGAIAVPITLSLIATITGFSISTAGLEDAVKNGLTGINFGEIVGGNLLGTGALAVLGSKLATWIGKAFAGSAVDLAITQAGINLGLGTVGATGAVLASAVGGIIAGIPMYIVGIYDAIKNGIDWLSGVLIPLGATASGAGIGAIIGALGGPIGAGFGALIGLIIGFLTDIVILVVQNWDKICDWCSTALDTVGQFFVNLWGDIVNVWNVCVEWFDTNVIQPVVEFFTGLWQNISDKASVCWDSIVTFFTPAIEWFSELFGNVFQTISDVFYNIGVIASGCWDIIKAVWEIVSEWFDTNLIQPVRDFFSELWGDIEDLASECWNGIKSVFSTVSEWFNTNLIEPVSGFFSELWDGFKDKASEAWEGIKSIFSTVGTFFKETFTNAWQGIVDVFSVAGEIFVDIKDGIVSAFKKVVNGIITGLNKVISIPFNGINSALELIKNIQILDFKPFSGLRKITVPEIPLLATGGFPTTGQMFVAREAGPELVGNIGRKSAVVNNEQIVASVSRGVADANSEQNMLLREQNSLLRSLLEKDTGTYLDGKKITSSIERVQRERGRTVVLGGAY